MELTRRDAVAALAAGGAVVGAGGWIAREDGRSRDEGPASLDEGDLETLTAVAEAAYPSDVTGVGEFVATYSRGRIERVQTDAYVRGVREAISILDRQAEAWYGAPYADLDAETRASLLHEVGAARVDPDPDGTDAQRVRHFLVNELLFALYASPTGGELVGIENPPGYPGGQESYRRGPAERRSAGEE